MSGRKQDPNDKDGARGRRERVERTGASGQAHRRIVLCGEYSSTCRKVRWRRPQEGDGTKVSIRNSTCFFVRFKI